MDNVHRDLTRLSLLSTQELATERFSPFSQLTDFTHYYLNRFLTNLTHAFKDFTSSEIKGIDSRHHAKLQQMFHFPPPGIGDLIIPIPKGMINSYLVTLNSLLAILVTSQVTTITGDIESLIGFLEAKQKESISLPSLTPYNQKSYDADRTKIGALYSTIGLTHIPTAKVLPSMAETKAVYDKLLIVLDDLYARILALPNQFKRLEAVYDPATLSPDEKQHLVPQLMNLAYRLSMIGVVADHLQSMEHAFVADLNIFLDHTKQQ